jgi:oligopeptide transport system substrate-binding protein
MNPTQAPFDDPKVRQAFAQALDVNKIIEVVFQGQADRSAGYVPAGVAGSNSALQLIPFDLTQAKKLIADSKYKSVDQLPAVTLYVPISSTPLDEAIAGMWQQNLGVKVNIQVINSYEEYLARYHRHEFQIAIYGWGADYNDPQDFLDVLFQSQSPENGIAYSNPAVDSALAKAGVEKDNATRLKQYQDIEKMILSDLPAIPLWQNLKSHILVKPYVQGFVLKPLDVNIWSDIYVNAH